MHDNMYRYRYVRLFRYTFLDMVSRFTHPHYDLILYRGIYMNIYIYIYVATDAKALPHWQ